MTQLCSFQLFVILCLNINSDYSPENRNVKRKSISNFPLPQKKTATVTCFIAHQLPAQS